jgi:hypothetical protein
MEEAGLGTCLVQQLLEPQLLAVVVAALALHLRPLEVMAAPVS